MDSRHRAQDIYNRTRKEEEEPQPTQTVLKQIFVEVRDFLLKTPVERKFNFTEFVKTLHSSCTAQDFDPMKASVAFENIEFYLILILKYPWKPEFRVLKPYCGFFQTKIESHIKKTEEIFKLMGYKEFQGQALTLTRKPTRDVTLAIGFECLVASVECSIISEIRQRLGSDYDVSSIVRCRLEHSGDIEQTVAILQKQNVSPYVFLDSRTTEAKAMKKSLNDIQADYVASSPNSPTEVPQAQGYERQSNIPYMDEDTALFEPGTLDEHLAASLRLVSSTSAREKRQDFTEQEPKKASDEWSFVHDKLRKDFGDSYYHGERGDVLLKDEGICLDKDESEREVYLRSQRGSKQTSGYASASHGDRSKSVGVSRKTTQDSGFAAGSSQPFQQIYYPPDDSRSRGPRTTTVSEDVPRQRSSAIAHAELSNTFPGKNSYESRGGVRSHPVTSPTGNRTSAFEMNPSNFSYQASERNTSAVFKGTGSSLQNFSHSAPIVRKTPSGVEYVGGVNSASRSCSQSTDDWSCPECTANNNFARITCVVCDKSRTDPPRKSVVQQQFEMRKRKQCPKCTLLNSLSAVECDACGLIFD